MAKNIRMSVRFAVVGAGSLILASCATAITDREGELENPLKGLAAMGGLATTVPEAKDFVVESRSKDVNFIPVGVRPEQADGKRKPMTEEEILLLKKKLEASQSLISTLPVGE